MTGIGSAREQTRGVLSHHSEGRVRWPTNFPLVFFELLDRQCCADAEADLALAIVLKGEVQNVLIESPRLHPVIAEHDGVVEVVNVLEAHGALSAALAGTARGSVTRGP